MAIKSPKNEISVFGLNGFNRVNPIFNTNPELLEKITFLSIKVFAYQIESMKEALLNENNERIPGDKENNIEDGPEENPGYRIRDRVGYRVGETRKGTIQPSPPKSIKTLVFVPKTSVLQLESITALEDYNRNRSAGIRYLEAKMPNIASKLEKDIKTGNSLIRDLAFCLKLAISTKIGLKAQNSEKAKNTENGQKSILELKTSNIRINHKSRSVAIQYTGQNSANIRIPVKALALKELLIAKKLDASPKSKIFNFNENQLETYLKAIAGCTPHELAEVLATHTLRGLLNDTEAPETAQGYVRVVKALLRASCAKMRVQYGTILELVDLTVFNQWSIKVEDSQLLWQADLNELSTIGQKAVVHQLGFNPFK
jgi:hypothetical protein